MHCSSCDVVVKGEFEKIKGIHEVKPDHKTCQVKIKYKGHLDLNALNSRIEKYGYSINPTSTQPKNISPITLGVSLVFVLLLLPVLKYINILGGSFFDLTKIGFATAFFIGIVASFSTCMATAGVFFLGVAEELKKDDENINMPHFTSLFSIGRILSYGFFGGLIGILGKSFVLNPQISGFFTIIISFLMILVALSLMNIRILNFNFSSQRLVNLFIGFARRHKIVSPFILGGATFFMPCGFTQSLQLYALQSGGFGNGALLLGIFAIGSLPSILGIGFISNLTKKIPSFNFSYIAAFIIAGFSIYNISNGAALMGLNINLLGSRTKNIQGASIENGKQVVNMTAGYTGYTPNNFVVKKGVPVLWKINGENVNGCQGFLVSPSLNISKRLEPGENTIEFTPEKSGPVLFSCGMGMFRGQFNVVDSS